MNHDHTARRRKISKAVLALNIVVLLWAMGSKADGKSCKRR